MVDVVSPLTGTVARVERAVGAAVDPTTPLVIIESMKMEYAIDAGAGGTLAELRVAVGDPVQAGDVLAVVAEGVPRRTTRRRWSPTWRPTPRRRARPDRRRLPARRPTRAAPIWPRSSTATPSASTPPGPTWSPAVTPAGTAPPARTSPTSSTRARSSSTAPS